MTSTSICPADCSARPPARPRRAAEPSDDRTLQVLRRKRATLAIGFAFDAQEAEDLPLEPTDQPLDMVVTDSRVLNL